MLHYAHLHLPKYKEYLAGGDEKVISMKPYGRHVFYVSHAYLWGVDFKVSEKGRLRTLATGQRNVHAWVVGQYDSMIHEIKDASQWHRAVYDPFESDCFVNFETFEPVYEANEAFLIGKNVYYRP